MKSSKSSDVYLKEFIFNVKRNSDKDRIHRMNFWTNKCGKFSTETFQKASLLIHAGVSSCITLENASEKPPKSLPRIHLGFPFLRISPAEIYGIQ